MLKIKDGKFYGSNYSFALPEGFYFNNSAFLKFGDERLEFGSNDGNVIIIIYFRKQFHSAKKDMQEIIDADNHLTTMGDFVSIKRGEGVGVGLYSENKYIGHQYYEERYDFKENRYGETQFGFEIILYKGINGENRTTIQEVLKLTAVKAFLKSVKYF